MDSSRELLAWSDVVTVPVAMMRFNLEGAVAATDCPDNTDKQGHGLDLSHASKVSRLP